MFINSTSFQTANVSKLFAPALDRDHLYSTDARGLDHCNVSKIGVDTTELSTALFRRAKFIKSSMNLTP